MDSKVFLIRIGVCFILSFIIGFERQYRRRTIGLRTNVLVCIGSFLFTSVGFHFVDADITRIPAQIVSGMGFLGAGVILREGKNIRGLNTAATLWCNAALGVLTASGMIFEAVVGTLFILFSNVILRIFANRMVDKNNTTKKFILTIACSPKKAVVIRTLLLQRLNREEVENICISNNIDIKTNKIIIKHISIQELKSKIAYLNSLNIKVVDNEGKLHEIFNMSNADMKEKYGISLTELINNYYIKERSM